MGFKEQEASENLRRQIKELLEESAKLKLELSLDAWTAQSTASPISRSEHRVLRVRYTFTPRRWQ